jgi:predicted amidohydrolase
MVAMRTMLTALTCPKGRVDRNLDRHLALLRDGAQRGCDLVLLPEMSLTGYRPGAAITIVDTAVQRLVRATSDAPALCFGLVEKAASRLPYITQVVAAEGDMVAVHRKAHLGEDEADDFQPGTPAGMFIVAGVTCTLAICAEIGTVPPYRLGSQVVLAPAAPGLYGNRRSTDTEWRAGFEWWYGSVCADAARLLGPDQVLAVSSQAGATEDEDFPGWAGLVATGGRVVAGLPDWGEGELVVEVQR